MDFFDDAGMNNSWAEADAFERREHALPQVDGAVSQTIAQAIRDATQTADPARQREAASWLLICCPDIAEQVELPDLHLDTVASLAAAYVVTTNDRVGLHADYLFG